MTNALRLILALIVVLGAAACTPEVGTKAWCDDMDKKPKGDWTANQAADYARHCVLNTYKDPDDG